MPVTRLRREMSSLEFETWRVYWAIQQQRQELERAKGD